MFVKTEHWIYMLTVIVTFTLCGLWHGEGVNFLVWGLVHGIYLAIGRITLKSRKCWAKKIGLTGLTRVYGVLKTMITFSLISFAWIFFAVPKIPDALMIIKKILLSPGTPFNLTDGSFVYGALGIGMLLIVETRDEFYRGRKTLFRNRRVLLRLLSYAALVIIILLIGVLNGGQFIYFQF